LIGTSDKSAYLSKLFECLVIAHGGRESPTRARVSRGRRRAFASWGPLNDPVSPLIQAIPRIGTEEAVTRYDELLTTVPDTEFLRLQRDAIAESLLADCGVAFGRAAAGEVGLPYVPAE
jgi:hypothetical protein